MSGWNDIWGHFLLSIFWQLTAAQAMTVSISYTPVINPDYYSFFPLCFRCIRKALKSSVFLWVSLPPSLLLLLPAVTLSLSLDSILGIGLDFSQQRSICDKLPFKGPLHYWWDQMCWLSLHTLGSLHFGPFPSAAQPLLTTLLIVLIA